MKNPKTSSMRNTLKVQHAWPVGLCWALSHFAVVGLRSSANCRLLPYPLLSVGSGRQGCIGSEGYPDRGSESDWGGGGRGLPNGAVTFGYKCPWPLGGKGRGQGKGESEVEL